MNEEAPEARGDVAPATADPSGRDATGPLPLAGGRGWPQAGQALVSGLAVLGDTGDRVRLLERFCRRLGGDLYPAFLRILCAVERGGEGAARALLASTLVDALAGDRLPTGRMAAWGASTDASDGAFDRSRALGPLEFLCAWYAQPSALPALSEHGFVQAASSLVRLVSVDARARALYCEALRGAAHDPLDGALAWQTRRALQRVAESWSDTDAAEPVIAECLASLRDSGTSRLDGIASNPFV